MDVFRRLRRFYWGKMGLLLASIVSLMVATALGLVYPNMLRILIDDVFKQEEYGLVLGLALTVLIVVSIKGCMQFLHGFFGGRLGNFVAYGMRNACYEKLQFLSFRYYDTAKTGDLMSRLTADLEAIRNFIGFGFAQILNMFLMIIFGGIMMVSINWQLTLITLIAIPVLAYTAIRFESKIHPAFREMRIAMSQLTTAVQENITGVRTVKSFARESFEIDKFSGKNEAYKDNQIYASKLWGTYFPIMELLASLSIVILLGVGGSLVVNETITLGELVAFFSLIWYIVGPMWGIGFHINNYTQSKASGERVLELLDQPSDVQDSEQAVALEADRVRGHVRFEDVSFGYINKGQSLANVSFDAPPGKVIGLIGGTGAGKSTIIQLLMRAYDVKKGKITLDGIDIRDIRLESLREQIATVFQETFLFSATIRNNIAYGMRDVTMEQIIRAAQLAKAHDFIMELPEGYDTVVGERGMGLSGGQKQRIAIARALLKNPKILILDDATSAVDMETEHEIQAGFRELMKGRTTFVIAHRISSLRHAHEILMLDQGRIVQRGTHDELIAQPGPYRDVYDIQYADKIALDQSDDILQPTSVREQVNQ
ncbi:MULTISPECIES: ABC transporter ATP-binding protein [unclassified Paenibacillus]|uniref:ABC transporter ATP-binding protein n=1 Tax=unclassified Paenibacillus TaxID=185978 RepID=UPI001C0F6B90|nr:MULTISPECIES: ABC transporter ATP-binding protein [unclassified Paenibacillus]MBU5442681.1 ABC transporter ATP-binding protein/permease [Paenibacillus sp. MSJ-34]